MLRASSFSTVVSSSQEFNKERTRVLDRAPVSLVVRVGEVGDRAVEFAGSSAGYAYFCAGRL
jgi:hypothetical protein